MLNHKLGLTDDPLSLQTGVFVGGVGMVTDLFQFNLVSYGGGRQDKVLVQVPDPTVTLQAAFDSRDTAEQVAKPQHLFGCAPGPGVTLGETKNKSQQFMV